ADHDPQTDAKQVRPRLPRVEQQRGRVRQEAGHQHPDSAPGKEGGPTELGFRGSGLRQRAIPSHEWSRAAELEFQCFSPSVLRGSRKAWHTATPLARAGSIPDNTEKKNHLFLPQRTNPRAGRSPTVHPVSTRCFSERHREFASVFSRAAGATIGAESGVARRSSGPTEGPVDASGGSVGREAAGRRGGAVQISRENVDYGWRVHRVRPTEPAALTADRGRHAHRAPRGGRP